MGRSKAASGAASGAPIAPSGDTRIGSVAVDHRKKMCANSETLNRSQATSSTIASSGGAIKTQMSTGRDDVADDLDAYMTFIDRVAERMRSSEAQLQLCPHHQHQIHSACHQGANMHPMDRYCLLDLDRRSTIYYCEDRNSSNTIGSCSCEGIMRASYCSHREHSSPSS